MGDPDMMLWERIAAGISLLSLILFSVWYTNYAIDGSERRQCELINLQIGVYDEAPPTTPTGVALADAYRSLQRARGC